jgi:hypothetical protein
VVVTDPRDVLKWAALFFAFIATASAEYQLALAVGFGHYIAAAVPGALDIYVLRALRVQRDVAAAVFAMILVNAGSHLVTAHLLPVSVPVVVAVSAIAPLVLWRVHSLRAQHPAAEGVQEQPVPAPVAVERAEERAAEPEAAAPAALDAAPQITPRIALEPGVTVHDAIVTAALVLGESATSRDIATALAEQHQIDTTPAAVRAALSRHRREQEQQAAQQGTEGYL